MSKVVIQSITLGKNPMKFKDPIEFHVEFYSTVDFKSDLVWKVIYVSSDSTTTYDQILVEVAYGQIEARYHNHLILIAPPPDATKIPEAEIIGAGAIMITCSYLGQEFLSVGYYLNNEYKDKKSVDNSSKHPNIDLLFRDILITKPHVVHRSITWDEDEDEKEEDKST